MAISESKQREIEILKYIKTKAKIYNWNGRGFQIFKIVEPFLFSTDIFANGKSNSLNGTLKFKPIHIDNLQYEIIGKEDYFKNGPLFYKVNSSGMVYPYNYFNFDIKEVTETKIDNLLSELDKNVNEIIQKYTNDESYFNFIKEQLEEKKGSGIQQTFLTNLVYLKKYDTLLEYISDCKQNNISSGMSSINLKNPELGWDFYDKLIEYIHKQFNSKK